MFLRRNMLFAAVTLCLLSLFGCVEQIDKAAIMKAAISVVDDQNGNLNNLFVKMPDSDKTDSEIIKTDEKPSGDDLNIENSVADLPPESEKTNEIIADGNNNDIEEIVDLNYDNLEQSVDNTSTSEKVDLQSEQSEKNDDVTAAIVAVGAVAALNDASELDLNDRKENIADTSVKTDSTTKNDLPQKTSETVKNGVSLENNNVNKENTKNEKNEIIKETKENLGNKERESEKTAYTETTPQTVEKSDEQVVASTTSNNNSVTEKSNEESQEYIINTNTKKFHKSSCGYAKQMKEENKEVSSDRNAIIADGYSPCKRCNP